MQQLGPGTRFRRPGQAVGRPVRASGARLQDGVRGRPGHRRREGQGRVTDPNGGVQVPGSFTCSDGRELFQVDANTGAASGWGFSNGKYTASKEAATDPKYHAAYKKCTS